MPTARARHIQVSTIEAATEVQQLLADGQEFAPVANKYSECPTAEQSGDLGEFSPEHMAPELDEVIFEADLGIVHGPIETEWGFHFVEILERTD